LPPLPLSSPCLPLSFTAHLEAEVVANLALNSGLDLGAAQLGVRVRNSLEGTGKGGVGAGSEVVVVGDGVAGISRVKGLGDAGEDVALDEDLGTITGVDSVTALGEVGVEDVAGTEADAGGARVDVVPVVVVLGDAEVAGVLGAVGVGVPDEGRLPVVVDVAVGDGDEVGGVGEVDQAVVVVLVVVTVGGEVDVVDPDVVGQLCGLLEGGTLGG
jgi:hypothetical protein